nr:DnaJ sub C member 7 [Polyrhizophydium stewartii]
MGNHHSHAGQRASTVSPRDDDDQPTATAADEAAARSTHFTLEEIKRLHRAFSKYADDNNTIDKTDFKRALENHVNAWSAGAQYLFLERLFDAFDMDGNHRIDFDEFINGLSVFFKGTDEEKQELSFRLYDIDKSGSIEPKELIKILSKMYSAFYNEDQTARVTSMVHQIFQDLDINGDGSLSVTEFKLMALKEPMMIDFVEQFLRVPEKRTESESLLSTIRNDYAGFHPPSSRWQPDRVPAGSISPEAFFAKYVATRTPCVLVGFPEPAPIPPKSSSSSSDKKNVSPQPTGKADWEWLSLAWLAKNAGDAVVSVERKDARGQFGSGRRREHMPFGDFAKLIASGDMEHYMTTQYDQDEEQGAKAASESAAAVADENESAEDGDDDADGEPMSDDGGDEWEDVDEDGDDDDDDGDEDEDQVKVTDYASPPLHVLLDRIPTALKLFGNLAPHLMNLWIGATDLPEGTSSGLHHDHHDNFYLLKAGSKRFRLFSPRETERMYLHGSVTKVHPNGLQEYAGSHSSGGKGGRSDGPQHGVRGDGAFVEDVAGYHLQLAQEALDAAETEEETERAEKQLDDAMAEMLQYQDDETALTEDEDEVDESLRGQVMPASERRKRSAPTDGPRDGKKARTAGSNAAEPTKTSTTAATSEPPSFSRVPVADLDAVAAGRRPSQAFTKIADATMVTLQLSAGEALYLPAGWFHEVRSFGAGSKAAAGVRVGALANHHLALNFWLVPPTTADFEQPYEDWYWRDVHWRPLQRLMYGAEDDSGEHDHDDE